MSNEYDTGKSHRALFGGYLGCTAVGFAFAVFNRGWAAFVFFTIGAVLSLYDYWRESA